MLQRLLFRQRRTPPYMFVDACVPWADASAVNIFFCGAAALSRASGFQDFTLPSVTLTVVASVVKFSLSRLCPLAAPASNFPCCCAARYGYGGGHPSMSGVMIACGCGSQRRRRKTARLTLHFAINMLRGGGWLNGGGGRHCFERQVPSPSSGGSIPWRLNDSIHHWVAATCCSLPFYPCPV